MVKVSKEDKKSKWDHLKDISIETSNLDISLLIGADMPHLHISLDVVSGDKKGSDRCFNQISLGHNGGGGLEGWGKWGGRVNNSNNFSSNSINSTHNTLENTVQRLWEVDSYSTTGKNDYCD